MTETRIGPLHFNPVTSATCSSRACSHRSASKTVGRFTADSRQRTVLEEAAQGNRMQAFKGKNGDGTWTLPDVGLVQ